MLTNNKTSRPSYRKLRGYAFDPSLSIKIDTAMINNMVYKIPWEDLQPGPVGDYLEVIDRDPSSRCFYRPVDLENYALLAQDGLTPSESNPQFHQQMVYAVAMTTIKNFEKALGRTINWSPKRNPNGSESEFVRRLRIYPHALREANAYYSPLKKSVLFGYFDASPERPETIMPGGTVYTCLSHDIIAHEITHALLDGMHRRYVEATHEDSLAFHEAFADIVALFQHFTFDEVLEEQIAKTRGNLASQNLLGELAQQFGKAIGHYGSLRDALGQFNEEKQVWEPKKPNTSDYQLILEPHERGSILVAAIFEMFITIYSRRIADLQRIASGGTGIMPEGSLHPDIIRRMSREASKTAAHILRMCVRALDYCPPMDITYGDYLRALISADYDMVQDDEKHYRIALIESFQRRGIYPENVRNMSVESLLCRTDEDTEAFETKFKDLIEFFKLFKEKVSYLTDREEIYKITKMFITGGFLDQAHANGRPGKRGMKITGLHHKLFAQEIVDAGGFDTLAGLIMNKNKIEEWGVGLSTRGYAKGLPRIEIHNFKLASRVSPDGTLVNQILLTITQRRGVVCVVDDQNNVSVDGFFIPVLNPTHYFKKDGVDKNGDPKFTKKMREGVNAGSNGIGSEAVLPENWFIFRGGSTLIFDLDYGSSKDNVKLKYVIRKAITDEARMIRQYKTMFGHPDNSLNATYFGPARNNLEAEPFAIIHKAL
ncbi:MAG: hypothetical protein ABWZ25_11670 [Chitinophagaceae bacterium]